MYINGKKVEIPKCTPIKENSNRYLLSYYCPKCNKEINIYDDNVHYYYTKCECGCLIANKNYFEEQRS